MEIPTSAYVIWTVWLVVAYLCVPVLLIVLTRILRAAMKIEAYARETRSASQGISSHLEAVGALDETANLLLEAHRIGDAMATGAEDVTHELLARAKGAR